MNQGSFCWYDLATTDPTAAAAFYAAVVGWEVEEVPAMHYTLLKTGGRNMAGIMTLPPHLREAGIPPQWCGYVAAAEVDKAAEAAQGAGAALKHGPEDIPGVGRFAAMTDPGGAPFYLFQPGGEPAPEPGMMAPGSVGWHELRAPDHAAAFDFYAGQFGWTRSRAIDMGPMGTYQLFAYDGADRGGMMNAFPGMRPSWLFYFVVDGLDAAVERVTASGGTIVREQTEVPGGAWIIMGTDPQGAEFALVSGRR